MIRTAGIAVTLGLMVAAAPPALAAPGGFDGDGRGDLAIGVAAEDLIEGGNDDDGAVNVLYGFGSGLATLGDQLWTQASPGIEGDGAEADDGFGTALAAGDFNGDGIGDLAVGVPFEDVAAGADDGDGAVHIIHGSPTGLQLDNDALFTQATLGIAGDGPEADDGFGAALAAGDFDGDGLGDLAVGVPAEDVAAGANDDDGAIAILFGSVVGLVTTNSLELAQSTPGIAGDGAEADDRFGSVLAAADIDRDGRDDLLVGVPDEDVLLPGDDAGSMQAIYGSAAGPDLGRDRSFSQQTTGIAGMAGLGDRFGSVLAPGDFDRDRFIDLAVGVPGEAVAALPGAGAVNVLRGRPKGLTAKSDRYFTANRSGIVGDGAEAGDGFGSALAAGDFDGDDLADLAVGVPGENLEVGANDDDGAVHWLRGHAGGISLKRNRLLTQETVGIAADGAEAGDRFGATLSAADLDGDGIGDLAIGTPGEDVTAGANDDDGAVTVIFGILRRGLTAIRDQLLHQSRPGVEDDAEAADAFGATLLAAG